MGQNTRQQLWVLSGLILIFLVPHLVASNYWLNLMNLACAMCIAALGLTILLGYTGQVNLAQMAFVGMGAYCSALLTVKLGFPVWLGILCAMAFTGFMGVVLGVPSLKLSGHYLAVTTIGFGFIVQLVLINWINVTNGSDGITQIPAPSLFGLALNTEGSYFVLSGTLAILVAWGTLRLKSSRMGRALLAIRINEMAASTSGVDTTRYKVIAFAVSSALAGLAGALFAHGGAHYISPDTFSFQQSVLILAMAVLGGDGSAIGGILGAVLFTLLPELLRFLKEIYMMVFAAAIVLIMIYMPSGITPLLAQTSFFTALRRKRLARVRQSRSVPDRAAIPPIPTSAGETVLEVRHLSKHFGGLKAVDDVDMTIARGRIHALIGPNGSGKTTTINLLSGLYKPTSGSIVLNGAAITGKAPCKIAERGIARTYQNIRVFGELTVLENVLVGAHVKGRSGLLSGMVQGAAQRREEERLRRMAESALAFVGLVDQEFELARNLPYGRQRMLEIARALVSEPALLLLDEPAAGLNPIETAELRTLLEQMRNQGLTVLLVEHDMDLVMRVSNTITVLNFGRKIAEGEEAEVRSHPEVINAYLGQEAPL